MSTTSTEGRHDEGVVEQASAKVQDAAATAQEKAGELAAQGRSRLSQQIDERSTEAGSQARAFADALREGTTQMRMGGNTRAADLASQAADQVQRLGSYLEQKNGDDFLRDVENFARRRPWLIGGFSVLAGIAAARFLKASSEDRYSTYYPGRVRTVGGYPTRSTSGSYGASHPEIAGSSTAYSSSAADDPLAPER